MAENNDLLTFGQARELLGVSGPTLRRMLAEKSIEHLRIGSGHGWIRFRREHIESYLRRRTVSAAA